MRFNIRILYTIPATLIGTALTVVKEEFWFQRAINRIAVKYPEISPFDTLALKEKLWEEHMELNLRIMPNEEKILEEGPKTYAGTILH